MQYQWCHIFNLSLVFFSFLLSEKVLRITFQRGLTKFTWNFSLLELSRLRKTLEREKRITAARPTCGAFDADTIRASPPRPFEKLFPKLPAIIPVIVKQNNRLAQFVLILQNHAMRFFNHKRDTFNGVIRSPFLIVPVKEWHHVHRTRSIFV